MDGTLENSDQTYRLINCEGIPIQRAANSTTPTQTLRIAWQLGFRVVNWEFTSTTRPPPPIKPEVLAIQVGTPKKDKFSLHVFCVLSKFVHRLSNVYQVSESAVWTSTNILFLSLYWYKPSSVLDEIMVQWVKTSAVPLQSSRKVGSENNDVAEMQTVQWLCYSSKAASSATLSCEARRWERKTAVK